jgi:hypothetical protein
MLRQNMAQKSVFQNLNRDVIARVLGTVVYDKAFFFYEDLGKPTGQFAVSISDFCNKISSVPTKSLAFHLKRGDFEKWIKEIIGDAELSDRLGKLKTNKAMWREETTLRNNLNATVKERINELQNLWNNALTWPRSIVA